MWGCCVCIYCVFIFLLFMLLFGALGEPGEHFKASCKKMFVGVYNWMSTNIRSLGQMMSFNLDEVENLWHPNNLRGMLKKSVQMVNSTKH